MNESVGILHSYKSVNSIMWLMSSWSRAGTLLIGWGFLRAAAVFEAENQFLPWMTFSKEVYLVAWHLLSDRAYVKILGCLDEWPTFCRKGVPSQEALDCTCKSVLALTDILPIQIRG